MSTQVSRLERNVLALATTDPPLLRKVTQCSRRMLTVFPYFPEK